MNFVNLHCHNEYSILDGVGTAEHFVDRVVELGQPAMGLTNHGNVDGLIKFQNSCEEKKIIPIHGCELYIVKNLELKTKGEKRKHITVWAKDETGWENLLKMLSVANQSGFYYRPRISPSLLLKHSKGLIIATACSGSFITEDWGKKLLLDLADKNFEDLYLEIMPFLNYTPQIEVNKECRYLHKKYKIKLLATNDCHFANKKDAMSQEVLLAIQSKKKWKDKDRWRFEVDDIYLKDVKEMQEGFKKQKIFDDKEIKLSINSTLEITDKCKNFRIAKKEVILPNIKVEGKEILDETKFIKKLCSDGMNKKIKSNPDKKRNIKIYEDRLEEELRTITEQKFTKYFLIVWELIDWCRNNDIMVGTGRGSSGGSLVCYLLNITSVDPIVFNLVFARFISPARIDLPDIDMDFEDIKRPLLRKHLEETYGKHNVAGCSTFLTMKGKGAIRDVSRVFDVPLADVNKASASIVVRSGGDSRSDFTIVDAFQSFEDGRYFQKKYPEVASIAINLEGQVRGKGQHAAAMIVSQDDLRKGKRAYLLKGKGEDLIVNWDKHDIEHVGLMKLDVLGLNALTVLNEARKLIKKNKNIDLDYESLSLDDEKVYEEFTKGNTIGCFQFGSLGLRKFCGELGIENFGMLTHANALFRPGTLRSGMIGEFVQRKNEGKKIEYIHPFIEKLTSDTYGIILYQEQVMKLMYELAGLGWKTADTVRKVISKSQGVEQFKKFKEQFIEGCEKLKTLNAKEAGDLWDTLSSFGSYSFNLSHAVEYSMIAYWDMYCKIHFPEEFICASLTYGSEEKKEDMIEEALRLSIDIRPPKLGISKAKTWIIKDNKLYCPFIEIKGFGDKTSEYSEQEFSNGKFFGEKLSKRFVNILYEIEADKDIAASPEYSDRIAKYFKFSFNTDPYRKFNKIIKILDRNVGISDIKKLVFSKPERDYKYYFGQMTLIKFGYRAKLDTMEKKREVAGTADNLGGVYGNFKDRNSFCMLVFNGNVYAKRKYEVEHCSGKFLFVKANHPGRATSILCDEIWTEEDLLSGNFGELKLNLIEQKRFRNKELLNCQECDLRKECTAPVLPSTGKYNIMIVGEAPWTDEDKQGEGFVGKTGSQILWPELRKYNYTRTLFNITNIVKCKCKSPKPKEIKSCLHWLEEEITNIEPKLILAFGNTSIKYFLGEESGIMTKSGTTEWNEKAGAWICWCIHPASVLYSPENKKLFQEGIENFHNTLNRFGFEKIHKKNKKL